VWIAQDVLERGNFINFELNHASILVLDRKSYRRSEEEWGEEESVSFSTF
jgi:hypothetical protein